MDQTLPPATPDKADLLSRLRRVEPDRPGIRTRWYRNPDGPEAAAVIESLRREVLEQRREIAGLREERAALIAADRPPGWTDGS